MNIVVVFLLALSIGCVSTQYNTQPPVLQRDQVHYNLDPRVIYGSTQTVGQSYHPTVQQTVVSRPNMVARMSGYYNPGPSGVVSANQHYNNAEMSINGRPMGGVYQTPPSYIINPPENTEAMQTALQWNREISYIQRDQVQSDIQLYQMAMRENEQNHRQSIDRARQEQNELEQYSYTVERFVRLFNR